MTPLYARLLLGAVRPFPNFDFWFIKPWRERAVTLLQLRPGARVLDVGCGSGAAFAGLVGAVGAAGQVLGVDISARTIAQAQRRLAANGWHNVELLNGPAQGVRLEGRYDGLLMFAAPDAYASPAALQNLFSSLEPRARVVFFGAKRSARRFGWVLNPLLHLALTRLSLPTTPGLEPLPWRHAAPRLRELHIEELFHGWMFLASGTFDGDRGPA